MFLLEKYQDEIDRLEAQANELTAKKDEHLAKMREVGDQQRQVIDELAAAQKRLNNAQAVAALEGRDPVEVRLMLSPTGQFAATGLKDLDELRTLAKDMGILRDDQKS
jgi:chromosome segregation ATPase